MSSDENSISVGLLFIYDPLPYDTSIRGFLTDRTPALYMHNHNVVMNFSYIGEEYDTNIRPSVTKSSALALLPTTTIYENNESFITGVPENTSSSTSNYHLLLTHILICFQIILQLIQCCCVYYSKSSLFNRSRVKRKKEKEDDAPLYFS